MDIGDFEKKIDIVFKDKSLITQAFTHRSYINENRNLRLSHNERLEFLGDAVLELSTTNYLYNKFQDKDEGELTSYRASIVNATNLMAVAKDLGIEDHLLLSTGEKKDTGKARGYILANTIEAIIGAIYLDQGFDAADKFTLNHITVRLQAIIDSGDWNDAKSLFQEKAQEIKGVTPMYKVLHEVGPDHDKVFTSGVHLGEKLIASGDGKSKQEAEQAAAKAALKTCGW